MAYRNVTVSDIIDQLRDIDYDYSELIEKCEKLEERIEELEDENSDLKNQISDLEEEIQNS